jgi:nicotinate dehydrogenase subunit A
MDGRRIRSCETPLWAVAGREITTIEGSSPGCGMHHLQQAFIDEQAAQCGYCINGMIMTAKAFLDENRNPTDEEIREALDGNLCRCGTHLRIIRAVKLAASKEGASL